QYVQRGVAHVLSIFCGQAAPVSCNPLTYQFVGDRTIEGGHVDARQVLFAQELSPTLNLVLQLDGVAPAVVTPAVVRIDGQTTDQPRGRNLTQVNVAQRGVMSSAELWVRMQRQLICSVAAVTTGAVGSE